MDNVNLIEQKIKITYSEDIEKINKRLKDSIIADMNVQISKLKLFQIYLKIILPNIVFIFLGCGMLSIICMGGYDIFFMSSKLSTDIYILAWLIFSLLTIISYMISVTIKIINIVKFTKQLISVSDSISCEEFFNKYDKYGIFIQTYNIDFYHLFYKTSFLRQYREYREFKNFLSLVSAVKEIGYDAISLKITASVKNGDIKKATLVYDKMIYNTNISTPELRIDNDYKISLVIPYK